MVAKSYVEELYLSGIVKVIDLISEERQFINLNHYYTSHHIKYNFIQNLSIRKAIPASWIDEITFYFYFQFLLP